MENFEGWVRIDAQSTSAMCEISPIASVNSVHITELGDVGRVAHHRVPLFIKLLMPSATSMVTIRTPSLEKSCTRDEIEPVLRELLKLDMKNYVHPLAVKQ